MKTQTMVLADFGPADEEIGCSVPIKFKTDGIAERRQYIRRQWESAGLGAAVAFLLALFIMAILWGKA